MFKETVTSTPFTSDQVNPMFQNITGLSFGRDLSMLATLRALMPTRMSGDDVIKVYYGALSLRVENLGRASNKVIAESVLNIDMMRAKGRLVIYSMNSDHESNIAVMDAISAGVEEAFPGFRWNKAVDVFYQKSFAVRCFVNPSSKTTLILVDSLNNRKLHYLQASIFAFMPWYLNTEKGLSEDEMALIYSLKEDSPEKYIQCLETMAEKCDFRGTRIRQLLDGFETRYERLAIDDVKRQINETDKQIRMRNDEIAEMIKRRNDLCIHQLGLERKIAEGAEESEIMNYFIASRHVVLENVNNNRLTFGVKTYLEYFDPDMAESAIRNRNSCIYCGHTGDKADKMERLMREVFLSDAPRIRVRSCAAYQIDINGSAHGISAFGFGSGYDGYIPNMHIQQHACMSTYESEVINFLLNHDYIGAIEQCVASAKSINFGDGTVLEEFMNAFWGEYYASGKCFELPDGSVVSMSKACEWLDSQEAGGNGETEGEATENE